MQALEIKPQILKRFGDPGQIIIKDADLAAFIYDGMVQILRQTGANPETETRYQAKDFIGGNSMDPFFINVTSIMYGGTGMDRGRPLTMATRNDLLEKGFNLQTTGIPDVWYSENGGTSYDMTLYLYPVPLSSDTTPICVVMTGLPDELPTDLAFPMTIPDAYIPDIITFAVSRCHEVNKDWNAANQLMGQFTNNIGQARHEALSGEGLSYPVIRDDPGYQDYYSGVYY